MGDGDGDKYAVDDEATDDDDDATDMMGTMTTCGTPIELSL